MKRKMPKSSPFAGSISLVRSSDQPTNGTPAPGRWTRKSKGEVTVVDDVARRTAEAAALKEIQGQELLRNPLTNPAVRDLAVRLQDRRHERQLAAEDDRDRRRGRVALNWAADAEKALEVIQLAEHMNSPARSVLALHKGRSRFLWTSMGASVVLSGGSAYGLAALASQHHASGALGVVAEIGLTGMSTMSTLYRTHLTSHAGRGGKSAVRIAGGWQDAALWGLTVVPLLGAVVGNLVSHGLIGVACSIGAALFGLFGFLVSDRSSVAIRDRAAEVTSEDKELLRRIAAGEGPDITVTAEQIEDEPADVVEDEVPEPTPTLDELVAKRTARREIIAPVPTPPEARPPLPRSKRPQDHPKWAMGEAAYRESIERGDKLSGAKLAGYMDQKNKTLAYRIIDHVNRDLSGSAER